MEYDWGTIYVGGLIASMLWALLVGVFTPRMNMAGFFLLIVLAITWPIGIPFNMLIKVLR